MPTSSRILHCVAFSLPLLTAVLSITPVLAQPDTTQRTFVPVAPPPGPPVVTVAQLQALVGGPTLVTFKGQDVLVTDVVKALLETANLPPAVTPIFAEGLATKRITIDWNQVPFWTAAQEVETLTGLKWGTLGRTRGELRLFPASYGSVGNLNGLLAAENPLMKITANSISQSSNSTLVLDAKEKVLPTTSSTARLSLAVYFEPKLRVESTRVRGVTVRNAQGTTLPNAPTETYIDPQGSSYWPSSLVNITLPQGLRSGSTISRINGTLRCTVALSTQTWKIANLQAEPRFAQEVGNDQYAIENVQVQAGELKLALIATKQRVAPGALSDVRRTYNTLIIRDAQGRELTAGSTSSRTTTAADGRTSLQIELTFRLRNAQGAALEGPFSFEWSLPSKLGTFDIPFELRDVPVP